MGLPLLTIYRGDSVSQDFVLRRSQVPVDLSSIYDIQVTLANDPSEDDETQTFSKLTNEITVSAPEEQGGINLALAPSQTEALLLQENVDLDVALLIRTPKATFTANTTDGSPTLASVSSFTNVAKGRLISGTGIPTGATVLDFDTTAQTITLSANASATATGVTVTPTLLDTQTYRVPNGLTVKDRST